MKKVFACLTIMAGSLFFTSCDSESSWFSGIGDILQNLLGITTEGDAAVVYSGTVNLEMYDYNSTENSYQISSKVEYSNTMQVTAQVYESDGAIVITLGDFVIGETTISNYSFTTYYENGTIDGQERYLTGATCTYNGTAETEVPCSCIDGTYTATALKLNTIYIQVGDKLIKGTYSGSAAAE